MTLLDIRKPKNNNLYWRTKSILAKEMKICSLVAQRKFIIDQMNKVYKIREDGNGAYAYKGIIYPENLEYFKNEGFTIRCFDSKEVIIEYGGPFYLIYPNDSIMLDEHETLLSEELSKQFYSNGFLDAGCID